MTILSAVLLAATCAAPAGEVRGATPAGDRPAATTRPDGPKQPYVRRGSLYSGGQGLFVYGVEHDPDRWRRDDRLALIRQHRFNAVITRTPGTLRRAGVLADLHKLGLWAIPSVETSRPAGPATIRPSAGATPRPWLSSVSASPAVLGWYAGSDVGRDAVARVQAETAELRRLDPLRPVFLDARTGHTAFARHVACVGWHTAPCQDPRTTFPRYRDQLLNHARELGPDNLFWTFVQAHQTPAYARGVTGVDPLGPTPYGAPDAEQVRLGAYLALSAGAKGLVIPNALGLTDDHQGMDRLAEAGLIGCELDVLGPYLAAARTRSAVPCSGLDVTRLDFDGGSLLVLVRCGDTDHLVPDVGRTSGVTIRLESVPFGARAYQVGFPAVVDVTGERGRGGMALRTQMFYLTSAILVTSSAELVRGAQRRMHARLNDAATFAVRMLRHKRAKVVRVKDDVDRLGHVRASSARLVREADDLLKHAIVRLKQHRARDAYDWAREGAARLRAVQRLYWQHAMRQVDDPAMSPYLLDYYLLPLHYRFSRRLAGAQWGPNLLANGSFEQPDPGAPTGWSRVPDPHGPRGGRWRLTTWRARGGQRSVQLSSTGPERVLGEARDLASVTLACQPIQVYRGDVFRIEAWVFIPDRLTRTRRGLVIWPGLGARSYGEARRIEPRAQWQQVVLYREAPDTTPARSQFRLHLGLCGGGTVYVDDVSVRRLAGGAARSRPSSTRPGHKP